MLNDFLPTCCTVADSQWMLPNAPFGVLRALTFEHALWTPEQSAQCYLPEIAGAGKRQAEFLAGRLSAREALFALTGTRTLVAKGADGAPLWPSGITGSITHGAGLALAMVAHTCDAQGLGIDIETLLSTERAAKLAGHIHTNAELKSLLALPEADRALRTTLSFSLKESLFKALYPLVKQRFYFHDAALINVSEKGYAQLKLLKDLSPAWPAGRVLEGQFQVQEGRVLSAVIIAQ